MEGRAKKIFRDVFDLMDNYDPNTYWDEAKKIAAKYTDPMDVVFAMDMIRAGQTYIESVKQDEKG